MGRWLAFLDPKRQLFLKPLLINEITLKHTFYDHNFNIFLERLLDPQIKGGPPTPHGSDKTIASFLSALSTAYLKLFSYYFKFLGEPWLPTTF